MKEKSIVIRNTFPPDGCPPITITVHKTIKNGKGVWVDNKGKEYGVSNQIPFGWDLVTPDDKAEFYHDAKLVTCWEHNFDKRNYNWLTELPMSPAYIYGMITRDESGKLNAIGCASCLGFETNEDKVMLELFAIAICNHLTKEDIELRDFFQQLEFRVRALQKSSI